MYYRVSLPSACLLSNHDRGIEQVSKKLRRLSLRAKYDDIAAHVHLVISKKRDSLTNFLFRFTRTCKKDVSLPYSLARLCYLLGNVAVIDTHYIIVMRINLSISNTGDVTARCFGFSDALAL